MKVKVLGIQSVDYVSRKTGNPVKGVTLHSAFKDAQDVYKRQSVLCSPGGVSARVYVLSWRRSARAVCPSSSLGSGLPWLGPFFERNVYGN